VFFQQKFAKLEFWKENQTQKNNYNNIVNNHGLVLGFGVPVDCSQQKAELFLKLLEHESFDTFLASLMLKCSGGASQAFSRFAYKHLPASFLQ
jgi:hypothetical protein